MIEFLNEDVPETFSRTLADFGIDVRGKTLLEVGSGGGCKQYGWRLRSRKAKCD